MHPYGELIDLIMASEHTVAFTGAGVSTASGIRDFRGKNGIYNDLWRGYRVEELFSIDLFHRDPSLFYAWAKDFVYCMDRFQPSPLHRVLAQLEARGKLQAIITQNIDMLHQRAGSQIVHEVHGSAQHHHCLACNKHYDYPTIQAEVFADHVPHCECGGIIKPDITFYGEALNAETFTAATNAACQTDLMIVLGSSLTVYPAASLPEEAYQFGARLAIINEQPTHLDACALITLPSLEEAVHILSGIL